MRICRNCGVEYDRLKKTERFQKQYPDVKYVVADANVLREDFGLKLSQSELEDAIVV